MKKIFLFVIILSSFKLFAQNQTIDSLKHVLLIAKADTNKIKLLSILSENYTWSSADTAVMYAQQALKLSQHLNLNMGWR